MDDNHFFGVMRKEDRDEYRQFLDTFRNGNPVYQVCTVYQNVILICRDCLVKNVEKQVLKDYFPHTMGYGLRATNLDSKERNQVVAMLDKLQCAIVWGDGLLDSNEAVAKAEKQGYKSFKEPFNVDYNKTLHVVLPFKDRLLSCEVYKKCKCPRQVCSLAV